MRWVVALLVALAAPAAASGTETPSAAEMLERVGFDGSAQKQVLAGEFVQSFLDTASDRDLAVALAFLVRATPAELSSELIERAIIIKQDRHTIAHGVLRPDSTMDDIGPLALSPDEQELYRNAKPGEDTNFSPPELKALRATPPGPRELEGELVRILLARYQAYRTRGLDGVAPYDRGHGHSIDAARELRRAGEADPAVEKIDADLYRFLGDYPNGEVPNLSEAFYWSHYMAHGLPTLILTHTFSTSLGGAEMMVERQYYVSRGYNVEQAIAAFMPVKEGTLVVYWNHTSTDQVAGFGGEVKRKVGERVMVKQLRQLFSRVREAADEQ